MMILGCKVRSIIFMASQDMEILLFGTLQNSPRIRDLDLATSCIFKNC